MGLNDIHKFNPEEKIIEYVMKEEKNEKRLIAMSLRVFMNETASESPAPGGGSVSAYMGALVLPLEQWLQIFQAIKEDGTTDGKSFQTGLKKARRFRISFCSWLMRIQKLSTGY